MQTTLEAIETKSNGIDWLVLQTLNGLSPIIEVAERMLSSNTCVVSRRVVEGVSLKMRDGKWSRTQRMDRDSPEYRKRQRMLMNIRRQRAKAAGAAQ